MYFFLRFFCLKSHIFSFLVLKPQMPQKFKFFFFPVLETEENKIGIFKQ